MRPSPAIWVDGEPATALPIPDRGLDFGDGLFETLLVRQGQPVLLDYHLQRLQHGIEALAFPDCLPRARDHLASACKQLIGTPWAALRLTVTRGAGPRGYAPPERVVPRTIITSAPLQQDRDELSAPITLGWAEVAWSIQPRLAGIKHLNRLEQVLAANEARALGVDEVVMLDARGLVCSVSAANLFLVEDGRLLTPSLEYVGIAGTRRRLVIEQLAPALNIEVVQRDVHAAQLEQAAELFCCNAIRGLQPVSRLGEQHWQDHPVCSALHAGYREAVAC
ncbi:aminodeoxychorismate lyase [Pseudohalioglobus lutimaris]|uniref:aminodeoxychorismate lyase n=1 Tax=Pseudohalioglobus lutimaris TaxID=1737061 RepID=UPI0013FE0402|nr:aminodeoxychorismate lyase [Pseudohalioglobus lutimaris]